MVIAHIHPLSHFVIHLLNVWNLLLYQTLCTSSGKEKNCLWTKTYHKGNYIRFFLIWSGSPLQVSNPRVKKWQKVHIRCQIMSKYTGTKLSKGSSVLDWIWYNSIFVASRANDKLRYEVMYYDGPEITTGQKWTGIIFFSKHCEFFPDITNNYCDFYACITWNIQYIYMYIYIYNIHFYKVLYCSNNK